MSASGSAWRAAASPARANSSGEARSPTSTRSASVARRVRLAAPLRPMRASAIVPSAAATTRTATPTIAKSSGRTENFRYDERAPSGCGGRVTAVTRSSGPAWVSSRPTKNSSAGISRAPARFPATWTRASLATSAAGGSAVGKPWATLPHSVPRLRICVVETAASAAASRGQRSAILASCSTVACVTIAPIRASPSMSTRRSGSTPRRPIRISASTRRSRMRISSDWPPAITFARSPCSASRSSASSTLVGSRYSIASSLPWRGRRRSRRGPAPG